MKKLLGVLGFTAMALLAAGCDKLGEKHPVFHNTDVTGVDYAKGFSLTDHTGKPRTLANYKGKVVL
ncbi:SCO family protein, partial [Acinetobacter baumannii]|nr:SCO family protein [Acinetobacter baumannii]